MCQSLIYLLSLGICLLWTFHLSGIIQHVAFYIWLLSLGPVLRYICVVDTLLYQSFFLMNEYNFIVWLYQFFFSCLSVGRCLDCFCFLTVINYATVSIYVQIFIWMLPFASLSTPLYFGSSASVPIYRRACSPSQVFSSILEVLFFLSTTGLVLFLQGPSWDSCKCLEGMGRTREISQTVGFKS